jgi:hypothetical protein
MRAMGIEWAFAFMERKRKTLNQIVTLKHSFSNLLQKNDSILNSLARRKIRGPIHISPLSRQGRGQTLKSSLLTAVLLSAARSTPRGREDVA